MFASLKLRIKFSWGIWAVYREIILTRGAAQLEFYFLQMPIKKCIAEEALSRWMKTRLDQSTPFLGCTKSLMRDINEPNLVFCSLSHPSIGLSQARKETPLPVPAVAWDGLCFPKGNWSKYNHPHLWAAACAVSVKHKKETYTRLLNGSK